MDADKTKILVLVEGEKLDVKLMDNLLKTYGIDQSHQIVPYKTNIYDLYGRMFVGQAPEEIDLLQLLKSKEPDEEKKKIFDESYSDILLIFDLDPQDPRFSDEKISRMTEYFVESSDMGKLYINYPMVEAFYHMKNIPDSDYNSYTATLDELMNHRYKGRVAAENRDRNFGKFATTKEECDIVIRQNIEKAQFIVGETFDPGEYIVPDSSDILSIQLGKLSSDERFVYVLCTCAFYIYDYNPKLIGL